VVSIDDLNREQMLALLTHNFQIVELTYEQDYKMERLTVRAPGHAVPKSPFQRVKEMLPQCMGAAKTANAGFKDMLGDEDEDGDNGVEQEQAGDAGEDNQGNDAGSGQDGGEGQAAKGEGEGEGEGDLKDKIAAYAKDKAKEKFDAKFKEITEGGGGAEGQGEHPPRPL
jgi:hypothetical protein